MSILNTVKKLLGIDPSSEDFDVDLLIHINSVMTILNQMGVGPASTVIIDKDTPWTIFTEDKTYLEAVKSYMYMKVRMMFDPPTSGGAIDACNNIIKELEWRLYSLENFKEDSNEQ